jgi:hypothetical protein
MKSLLGFSILSLFIVFTLACNSAEKDSVRDDARSTLRDIPPGTVPPVNAPVGAPSAVNTSGVQHYICPNNCQGSGGASAGTCPVCGSEYSHNQAYHNQPASGGNAGLPSGLTLDPTSGATSLPSPTATPEPAQNAAGVWHYTCSAGCTGGAGSAGNCASCGQALAHNAAYHN